MAKAFTGTGQVLTFNGAPSIATPTDLTVLAWVFLTSYGQNSRAMVMQSTDTADALRWSLSVNNGDVANGFQATVGFSTTDKIQRSAAATLATGKWWCIGFTFNSSTGAITLWVGDLATPMAALGTSTTVQASVGTADGSGSRIRIGNRVQSDRNFDGSISQPVAWSRLFTNDEIEDFRGGYVQAADATTLLIADFDTSDNLVAVDLSGNYATPTFTPATGTTIVAADPPGVGGAYTSPVYGERAVALHLSFGFLWNDYSDTHLQFQFGWDDADPGGDIPQPQQSQIILAPLAAVLGPTTKVIRRVDIYESDGVTPWLLDAPVTDGSVSVDMSRDERRTLDITFDNSDKSFKPYPEGFWYDKVIKVFRGVYLGGESTDVAAQGEFLIDRVSSPHFPYIVKVTGRDYTKKLLTSKFARATAFTAGSNLDDIFRSIALNGGITKLLLPATGIVTTVEYAWDRGTTRWKALQDLSTAYNYDVYFTPDGYLTMTPFVDPTTSPLAFTFGTGPGGSLTAYEKSIDDTRIYNHVVVTGTRQDLPDLVAEAINTEPSSPTNVSQIGDRLYEYTSSFFTDIGQCQAYASSLLRVNALESFVINISSLVIYWLDAGVVVGYDDPDPAPGDPDRFLLTDFQLPLALSALTGNAKRVTIVG